MTQFFLGAHRPRWLDTSPLPLFVSDATLRVRGKDHAGALDYRAQCPWALDSGAFSEEYLSSCDSMAWSAHERAEHADKRKHDPTLPKTGRQNELAAAIDWYNNTVEPAILRAARASGARAA